MTEIVAASGSSLTQEESAKLARLETVIEDNLQGFKRAGMALLEIRDSRLYRAAFETFEAYCQERWSMTHRHANRLIQSAEVAAALGPIGPIPENEAQARPLVGLEPEDQREVWRQAVESAPAGVREKAWDDILLEYWSNYERRVRGWVAKPLACDFIAYAFVPTQTCYLLPSLALRRAWKEHGRHWVETCQKVEAHNETYTTVSVAVPIDELFIAIDAALRVQWGAA